MNGTTRGRRIVGYLVATIGTVGLVLVLLPFRDSIDPATVGWAFLALVVASTVVGGIGPGIVASIGAFACSNYFFVPPYDTFQIAQGEHVVMLFVLFGLSGLIAFLLARARARAEAAEARAQELQLQRVLARALVEPVPGDENYRLVLGIIVNRLGFRTAALLAQTPGGLEELVRVPEDVQVDLEGSDDRTTVERIPLVVGRRSLGLLILTGRDAPSDASARRTLEALGDQLSLVMERDRMLRAAVEAEAARRPR